MTDRANDHFDPVSSPDAAPGNARKAEPDSTRPDGLKDSAEVLVSGGDRPPGTIKIFAPIGTGGYGLPDLRADLESAGNRPVIEIHSPGGNALAAMAMARLIEDADAVVLTHSAGSAAVILATAGRARTISSNGWLGLHPAWSAVAGGSEQFEAAAKHCREIDALLVERLVSRSRWSESDAISAIKSNAAMNPAEALAFGMVDEIGPPSPYATAKPNRIDDSRRAAEVLTDHARRRELFAEVDAIKDASEQARKLAPSPEPSAVMSYVEAMINSDTRAQIFRSAANHARTNSTIWPAWWRCEVCQSRNYSAPVTGWRTTPCAHCQGAPSLNKKGNTP